MTNKTAPHHEPAQADDTRRAAIEHLQSARNLLKKIAAEMKKDGSPPLTRTRIIRSLKLAESALRTARRCQTIDHADTASE